MTRHLTAAYLYLGVPVAAVLWLVALVLDGAR